MNENESEDLYGDGESAQRVGNGPESKAPASKLENVSAVMRNPKASKVIIATVGALVVVGGLLIVAITSRNSPQQTATPPQLSGANVGTAPSSLSDDPNKSLAESKQYQEMVAAAGRDRAQAARDAGQSTQPLATTVEQSLTKVPTPAEAAASAAQAEQLRQQQAATAAAQAAAQAAAMQQPQGYAQPNAQDPAYQQMQQNAQQAIAQLMAPRPRGSQSFAMVDTNAIQAAAQAQAQSAGQAAPGVVRTAMAAPIQAAASAPLPGIGASAAGNADQVTLISAGLIESARIDTAVNTDVGGEFGATLLTGQFAGAKLIGTVQRKGELAQMSLRTMSLPGQGVSVSAAGVILDAQTAETGTATDVDRKLFVKYGVKPLAAGFAAVSDYLRNSGTTVVVNGETVASTQPELTSKKTAQIIGGAAAQQVNSDANALDTTPTVRVARGAVVGVFFTQDVLYSPRTR